MIPARVKAARNIVCLEQKEALILVNSTEIRPLLIQRGKAFILDLLKDADKIRASKAILTKYGDPQLLNALVDHHILIDEDDPETYQSGLLKDPAEKTFGISLYLLVSQECNLGCVYCLNGERTYRKSEKPMMSEDVAMESIRRCLKRLEPGGNLEIVFFGGEPLLNWPLIKKVILHCEGTFREEFPDRRWKYSLTTNLTFFPPDLIEWIKRYSISVLCDVDGPPKLHNVTRPFRNGRGTHARIRDHLERLKASGVEASLRCTVTSHNVDHMLEVAAHHRELGGSGSAFVAVNAVTSDEDILPEGLLPDPEKYAQGLKDVFESRLWPLENLFPFSQYQNMIKPGLRTFLPCGAPYGNTPVVDVSGDVYACIYLVGIKAYKLGNIYSPDDFPDKEVMGRMREVLSVDNTEGCSSCALRYICAGGCPVGRLSIAGNPKATERVERYTREVKCATMRTVFETILWEYADKGMREIQQITGGSTAGNGTESIVCGR